MPWTLQVHPPDVVAPAACPDCKGTPHDEGDGYGRCSTCGAVLLCPDPGPGEVYRVTLTPTDPSGRRMPKASSRSIQVEWGERRQSDGTVAGIYRLIDKQNNRYIERIRRADGSVGECDEPLSEHRGHGSDRPTPQRAGDPRARRWVPLTFGESETGERAPNQLRRHE